MAKAHCKLQKLFPHLQMVSFSDLLLSSETHMAKIIMSISCYAHGKMNPHVWNTEPVTALLSDVLLCLTLGDRAKVKPEFSCWKRGTYLLLQLVLSHSAGHPSAAVCRATCGWKSCRRKREAQRQVSETLKNQGCYQDPNMVSLWRTFLQSSSK